MSQNVILQSEAVLCAPRLSLQYQSALCISNHIFGRMSIKPLPLFAFSFIFSFSPGAALLCCCRLHIILCLRFPPALRDQTRRWYRDAAGQPMRNVNGRFALHKGIEAAVNLVLRNRIQRRRFSLKNHRFFHSGLLYCLSIKNAKVAIKKLKRYVIIRSLFTCNSH